MSKKTASAPVSRPSPAFTAAAALLAATGLFGAAAAAQNLSADILVVGAGGAGMAAAIEAREASGGKAKVVILEKLPFVGGTTLLASTAYNAGGSKLQPDYSAEDYAKKLLKGVPKADEHDKANIKQLAELSGPTADWLIDMGADMSRIINGSQMTPADGSAYGAMIVPVLKKRIDALGIEVVTNADVEELITDASGRVTGVRAHLKTGQKDAHLKDIAAQAVILATGGFASNPKLVERFTPQWAGYPSTASVGATGDGILMAEKLGAKLDNMALAGPQTVAYDTGHGAVSLTNVRYNGAILVGKTGKRFTNELGSTATIGADIKAQPDGVAFLIFDRTSVENAALMKKYEEMGYFVKADTLDALAVKLGVDQANLKATVARWQGFFDKKKDDDFGRTQSMFSRIDRAPYYGQKISPASQTTYGGVERNADGAALKPDGTVIPGLFVAGETADQYGQGVSLGIITGRIAARGALKAIEAK